MFVNYFGIIRPAIYKRLILLFVIRITFTKNHFGWYVQSICNNLWAIANLFFKTLICLDTKFKFQIEFNSCNSKFTLKNNFSIELHLNHFSYYILDWIISIQLSWAKNTSKFSLKSNCNKRPFESYVSLFWYFSLPPPPNPPTLNVAFYSFK